MSMPSFVFPADLPSLNRDALIDQLLASIALEELSLSHILNAEGEKIQYCVGTLLIEGRGLSGGTTIAGLTDLDNSVAAVLTGAAASQAALTEKLRAVLDAISGDTPEDEPGEVSA